MSQLQQADVIRCSSDVESIDTVGHSSGDLSPDDALRCTHNAVCVILSK